MHTLLALSSVLLVVLSSYLTIGALRRLNGWSRRRDLQLLALATPVVSLGVGLGGLHHFTDRICFLGAPSWDYLVGLVLPLIMGLIAVSALALGLVRLALLYRVVGRRGTPAGAHLRALAAGLAEQLQVPRPRVLLCPYNRPLALTCGLWRPTLLLSTWMVEHLDRRELEAVLAHELGHVARRDYLVVWLATVLRDAFFYLPTSWTVYRQLQQEKELASDDLAVSLTNRPLALASALAKVWQQALGGQSLGTAPALLGADGSIERRIERLLTTSTSDVSQPRSRLVALGIGSSALIGLLIVEGLTVALTLAPMGCGPASQLWRL
ncbi:MAG: M56 family metallopeptidase [Chloroflexi bacterium]|nr:M56 family metallopeptidase [Chloroflexota bacterium]